MKVKLKKKTMAIIAIMLIIVLIAIILLINALTKQQVEIQTANLEEAKPARTEKTQTVTTDTWNMERVNIVYDTEGVPVPVPKGFVMSGIESEQTIDTGVVIYQIDDDETYNWLMSSERTEEELNDFWYAQETAFSGTAVYDVQREYNQYVWVPIYDASEIYGTDSSGLKHGKLYSYDSTGRTASNWTEKDGVMSVTSSTSYREPDVIGSTSSTSYNYDKDDYLPYYLTEDDREELYYELIKNFNETIESIETYGGFYIGRYETGGLSTEATVTKENTDIASQNWYTMYTQCKTLKGTNDNVTTSMIWGCLWDATLEWLVESECKTYSEVGSDSRSWGNYSNSTFTYTNTSGGTSTKGSGTRIPTGSTEYTNANNIYDMAGNVWDWTLEAYSTNDRVYRGGGYNYGGVNSPADNRYGYYPYYSTAYVRVQVRTLRSTVG